MSFGPGSVILSRNSRSSFNSNFFFFSFFYVEFTKFRNIYTFDVGKGDYTSFFIEALIPLLVISMNKVYIDD